MIPTLRTFTERMMTEFHSGSDMRFEAIGAYLKLFLIECNSHCSLFPGTNPQTIEVGKTLVRSFRETVERKFRQWHQVQDYAQALFVTPNYLNDVIRSSMDVTAKEFIQNRIILEAKRMATFTAKSSKEIGYDLGFDDPAHFSKFFKSATKQSVQEFRSQVVRW